jgi:lipopolysaccharide transport system permease protein
LSESQALSVTHIQPRGAWHAIPWSDLLAYRELILVLSLREIKLRYRQTILGVIWVVLQPLIAASAFTIVFGRIAKLPSDGVPYFYFAFAGFLAWNSFQSTVTRASASLVQNSALVTKVYFPRAVLPLSTLPSTLVDLAVGVVLLLGMMAAAGVLPTAALITLPLWILLIQIGAAGIGLYAAALMVSYRDVQHALPTLLQLGMYVTPVAYASSALPERFHWLVVINPLSGLIDAFRWSLLGQGNVDWRLVALSGVLALVVFGIGMRRFHALEQRFADVI